MNRKRITGLKLDLNNMMKSFVGEYGISDAEISSLSNKIAKAHKAMLEKEQTERWTGEIFHITRRTLLRT